MNLQTDIFEIREVTYADSNELANLLNAIIAKGGTTALEEPFTAEELARTYLIGPEVHCCFVATNRATKRIEGFQMLCHYSTSPDEIADIGTFTRLNSSHRGIGTALFVTSRLRACDLGLSAINATISADNAAGLAFYKKQGFVDHMTEGGVPLKDGRRVDRIIKRYALMRAETV